MTGVYISHPYNGFTDCKGNARDFLLARVDIFLWATGCGLGTLQIAKQMRLTFTEGVLLALQHCRKRRWLHGPGGRAQPQSPTPIQALGTASLCRTQNTGEL